MDDGSPPAVSARGLRKTFGRGEAATMALDGLDLRVAPGGVHGLLGPNGAGKTTALRVLTTLLRPDAGTAEVAGHDVVRDAARARAAIGLVGQHAAVDEVISGRQNLVMFGRLHHQGTATARRRAAELLDAFGLADAAERPVKDYSGGMRRRLDLAAGLIRHPRVLFLDEPTTGLDPHGRAEVWRAVRSLAGATTVVLTTQYLEEADQLCGCVSVIDAGRVVAEGSPAELKERLGGDRLDVVVHDAADLAEAATIMERICGSAPEVDRDTRRAGVPVHNRVASLTATARALEDAGVGLEDIALRRPTLDEVFLHLTGHHTEPETATMERNSV